MELYLQQRITVQIRRKRVTHRHQVDEVDELDEEVAVYLAEYLLLAFTPMAVQIILMVLVNSMVVDEVDGVDEVDEVDELDEEVAKEEVDSKIDQCQQRPTHHQ